MNNIINKLINKNNWKDIIKLFKLKKIDPNTKITNKTILQIASANNQIDILRYILKNDPIQLTKSDNIYGESCLHILANYSYIDSLKECILKHPNFITTIDHQNNTILHILYDNTDFLQWLLDNLTDIDINTVNNHMHTILTQNIKNCQHTTDKYYKNIQILLKFKPDLTIPYTNPPLIYSLYLRKGFISKLLLDNNADGNVMSSDYITPLFVAIYQNMTDIVQELLKRNVDLTYNGVDGDKNPLILCIIQKKYNIADMLLDNNFNIDSYNNKIESTLHYAFNGKKNLPANIISKLLFNGNINIQNTKGDTPLHLFLKNYNWKNFNKILETKKLDVFIKNKNGIRPIDYIKTSDITIFIDMLTHSYINQMDSYELCKDNFKSTQCKNTIKSIIFKNNKSFPEKKETITLNNSFKFIEAEYTIHGLFNSDTIHNMIYTIIMLKKYNNLALPYQNYIHDKVYNDRIIQTHNDLFRTPDEIVIADLIKIYTDMFYELSPYLIVWKSKYQYYINKDLNFYLQKCLINKKIRFIFLKLTLVPSSNGTHANIIIFDKKTGILERFEPFGYVPYLDSESLDSFIKTKFYIFFKKYLLDNELMLQYFNPKLLFGTVGFQLLSADSDSIVRKLGDPSGYCLAWTFWYLEMRLKNQQAHPRLLIERSLSLIVNKYDSKNGFIDFIRNYAYSLDKIKNKFMLDAGINIKNLYSIILSENDQKKIALKIISEFHKFI